jgi:hypothetical protein
MPATSSTEPSRMPIGSLRLEQLKCVAVGWRSGDGVDGADGSAGRFHLLFQSPQNSLQARNNDLFDA